MLRMSTALVFARSREQEEGGGVVLTLDLGKGKIFTLSGIPGKGPFSVSTVHPFLLDGLFVENLEEIQAQARRIQVVMLVYFIPIGDTR